MAFPSNPDPGDKWPVDTEEYIYNASIGAWESNLDEKIQDNTDDIVALDLNVDTDGTLAANLDTNLASQKAIKTYVDNKITSHDTEHDDRFLQSSAYTAADVLTKLLTVDGDGTLLDSDKIDGADLQTTFTNSAVHVPSSSSIYNMLVEVELTSQDISSASQTTALASYEIAANDKKIYKISWYGGTGTYHHKITSGANLRNIYVDLPPGDMSSTYAWSGWGNGSLLVRWNHTDTKWDVLTEGCFDKYGTPASEYFIARTDKSLKQGKRVIFSVDAGTSGASAQSWSYPIVFSGIPFITPNAQIYSTSNFAHDRDRVAFISPSTTAVTIGVSVTAYQASYYGATADGEWRD